MTDTKEPLSGSTPKANIVKIPSKQKNPSKEQPVISIKKNTQTIDDLEIESKRAIDEINSKFYHIVIDGQNKVIRLIPSIISTGKIVEFFKPAEFVQLFSHDPKILSHYKTVGKYEEPVFKNPAEIWLEHEDANHLDGGLDFDPKYLPLSITPNNRLNIWLGLGVEPQAYDFDTGDEQVDLYLLHLFDVICDGDSESYKYLHNYIAHMVQRPEEKPSIAIVMKAGQGAGKGTAIDPLKTIMGSHAMATTSNSDVAGKFNSALEAKILVFFDEAFAGSKEASKTMKGLISENYTRIERKGVNSTFIPNYMRIFIASNDDNIVIIEDDDRRYLFLKPSEKYKQNTQYFNRMSFSRQEDRRHNQFCRKLLHYLLSVDISDFDRHRAPITEELTKQKLDYLKPEQKWVYTILSRGWVTGGKGWPNYLENEECYSACMNWMQDFGYKPTFGDLSRNVGKALTMAGINSGAVKIQGEVKRQRKFLPIEECKKIFEISIKGRVFNKGNG